MSLDASTLKVVVQSDGIENTTKALNDLAAAGAKAEKSTSNIGRGAKVASQSQTDAAQQAVAGYNALASSVQNAVNAQRGMVDIAAKIQAQVEKMDMMAQVQRWRDEAAALRQANAEMAATQRAEQRLQQDAQAFTESIRRQAETIGMSTKELRDYNAEQLRQKAAQLGVTQQTEGYINTLRNARGPHESFNLLTAGSARELMVLGHELSQGNFQRFGGSLIVLGERINFLPSVLEKAGAAASMLGVGLGVLIAGIAAIVAVTAGAIISYNKSTTALREMKDAVVMTGGAIGATGDQLYTMANSIGAATGEFGKAREAVIALANTGKFSADQIGMIAEAAVNLEKYGGQSIEKTAAMFEKLAGNPLKITDKGFKDVSNAAMQLDEQLHFLSPTVLAHIMDLERQGEHASASKVAIAALAEEEKKRAEELKSNLTPLGQLFETIGEKASRMWNSVFHKESLDDQLKSAQEHLSHLRDLGHGDDNFAVKEDLAKIKELQNQIVQDNYNAAEQAHKKTLDRLANEQLTYMRNLMERAKGEENLQQRLVRFDTIIAQQREKAKNDPAFAAQTRDYLSDASVAMMRQQIARDSQRAQPKPKSDGLSGLNQHLAEVNGKFEIDKRYYDNQVKFIDDLQQKHLISDAVADQAKKSMLENEAAIEEQALRDQISLVDQFHSKDTKLMEQAATKKADIQKRLDKFIADNQAKQDRAATDPAARAQKEQDDLDKQAAQFIKQTADQTASIQAKIDAYNALPASLKAAGVTEKQMQDEITQAIIDQKEEKLAAVAATGPASAQEVVRLKAEIAALKDKTAAQKAWEAIQDKNNAALNRSAALTRIATDQVKMWKDAGNEIEKSLKTAFGNAGEAAGKMFKAFADGQATQIDLMDKARKVSEDKSLSETQKAQQLSDIRLRDNQAQLGFYGQMTDAAATFFDQGSTGYQAMAKAAMVLHTAEVALSLIKGVNAILTQGSGDPYSAFARMAAMAAIVAGLGVAISGSFGGGGGSFSSADQQKIQGTGTVLGSPTITDGIEVKLVGAKSDSIANSLKIAEKNSGLGLVVQNDMLTALQKLNDSISSFATLVVRDYNIQNPNVGSLNTNNGGMTTFLETGSVLGYALAKIIPGVGNLFGKIATSIFGGKQTVDDSGITLGSQSLGSIAANGVNAQSYANITTSGGWFSSDKHDTKTQSLGADFNASVTQVVMGMEDTLKTAAKGLGLNADVFNQKLQSFIVDIGNISFKGMTGDQIQQTLQNVFSKLGDQMATYAFGDLQKYQKVGEGLMETVVRVANDLQQVNDVFTVLGKTIPKGLAGIAQAESLITSFGSLDNLTKGIQAYVGAIYSDQDKLAYITKDVTVAMDGLNLSSVKTKEQFKAVVDGLDLTTQAGQDLLAKLINIAPEFGQMVDGADKAATDARSALTAAYNKESQAIKDTQSKMQSLVTTLKQLASSSLLGDLSPLTPEQKYLEAKSQFETVAAKAQSGDETAQGQFESAYNAFLSASKVANASGEQYQRDFAEAQKVTQQATEWAQKQVDVAQATLDALNKQVAGMVDVTDGLTTVTQAINNLVSALGASGQAQATTNTQNAIESMFESILKRQASSYEMQIWSNAIGSGESMSDLATALSNGTPTTVRTAPVHAMISSQAATNADVVAAINGFKESVTAAITESGQNTVDAVQGLVGPLYDSGAATADATATGVAEAVQSSKVGTTYVITQR